MPEGRTNLANHPVVLTENPLIYNRETFHEKSFSEKLLDSPIRSGEKVPVQTTKLFLPEWGEDGFWR